MSYGLPYKGSKSRIANELIACLPNAENFYDMFVGGGAVTHRALLEGRWRNVFINDINPLIPQLFLDSVNGKYHNCTRWVSREEFHEQKATDGLVAVCYSFGNNLRQYLYNEDVEPYKRAFHIAVAERDYAPMQEFGVDLSPVDSIPDIHWRRIEAQNIVAENENENIQRCSTCETLSRYERLQWLERLNRFKDKLHMTSLDYREVEIKPNSLIYCDIPYYNTDGYVTEFNHDEFYDWACNQENPVYISSYWMPEDRFDCVMEFSNRSTFSRDSNSTEATERLFIPKGQHHIKTTLF